MKRGREEKQTSRSSKRQHHNEKEKKSNDVPFDIMVDILSRLPVKSLVRFQCVSKLWSTLIIDSIVTRSSTQPRLLVIFPHWLLKSSLFSSSTNPLMITTHETFISAYTHGFVSWDFDYEYIRGLICCSGDTLISNPTSESDLPEITCDTYNNSIPYSNSREYDGFLGYDPAENQVFTLLGGPKKEQWRSLDIQGTWNHSPATTSNGLCINGIIYYIDTGPEFNELRWFDITFQRFNHVQLPITLQTNPLEELTLVNYHGKLGCIRYSNGSSAEILIMDGDHDSKKQEWSTMILSMPLYLHCQGDDYCIAGLTPNGGIVLLPKTLGYAQPFIAYCYDPNLNSGVTIPIEF